MIWSIIQKASYVKIESFQMHDEERTQLMLLVGAIKTQDKMFRYIVDVFIGAWFEFYLTTKYLQNA